MKRDLSLTVRRSRAQMGKVTSSPLPPLSREAETRALSEDSRSQAGLERRQSASVGVCRRQLSSDQPRRMQVGR